MGVKSASERNVVGVLGGGLIAVGAGGSGRVFERCAINWVAENGSAEIFEMDPELVGAAGGGLQLQQAILVALGDDAIGGLGGLAILVNLEGGGAFQVAGDG